MLSIFSSQPKRLDILNQQKQEVTRNIRIVVYRNHSFEIISSLINSFMNFWSAESEFIYSDYDDSLNFQYKNSDVQIIWIDTNRYNSEIAESFLIDRIKVLRSFSNIPILVLYLGDKQLNLNNITTDCYAFWVDRELKDLGESAYDMQKLEYSGTRLSNRGCIRLAQIIGLRYLYAILNPPLKAIIVDLDNTLYSGILGEDGIVSLKQYEDVQQKLKSLKQQGFFLCISSKNEEDDVRKMFSERIDFKLSWDDFTFTQINWNSKAENILKISNNLNINTDAILFIDDNPAEIENVRAQIPNIKTILAENPESTIQMLDCYPGLLKLWTSNEDSLRSKDIQANVERLALAKQLSPKEYFEKLGIELIFSLDMADQKTRALELLGKTNQFILAYKRYKETEVNDFICDETKCLATIHMKDNLSDSGIITILVAHKDEKNHLVLDDLVVSCRALGRNLENIMLPKLFQLVMHKLNCNNNMYIPYKKGERNTPALSWLSKLTNMSLENSGSVIYQIPEEIDTSGINIRIM